MACERKCFSVKWRIEKFRSWLQKQESVLYSPEFAIETMEGTKWRLSLSSECEPTLKYIALAVLREVQDDGPKVIDLEYELSFLANDDSPLKREKFSDIFFNTTSSHELMVKRDTVLVEKRHHYLHQDNLIVSCRIWRNRSSVAKNGRCFIRSVIGLERIALDGIIENFSSLGSFGYRILNFIQPSTGISLVSLKVFLNGSEIKFERMHCRRKYFFTGRLFAIDTFGKKRECEAGYLPSELVPEDTPCWFYLSPTIERLATDGFLPNDIMTLQYEVAFCPGIELENIEYEFEQKEKGSDLADLNVCYSEDHYDDSNTIQFSDKQIDVEKYHSELSTSFKKEMTSLYNDHLFCDTLLQTGTETFPAHKSVVSARSPVFRKMFTTDMKEKAGECINISDLNPDIVRRMLLFIYTDATDDLDWENAKALYFAADKYEILTLKWRCLLFFTQNLTSFRVIEILILADRHQDDELKSAAQEYILNHDQEVFGLDEWKIFMEDYCHLAAQVMFMQCLKR